MTAPHQSLPLGSLALIAAFVVAVAAAFAYTAGWFSPQRLTPGKLVDAFAPPSGPLEDCRSWPATGLVPAASVVPEKG